MDPSSISVEITIALTFLQDLAAFSKQLFQEDSRELVEKIADLNLHLNFAAPFGQLQDVPLGLARSVPKHTTCDQSHNRPQKQINRDRSKPGFPE